MKTVLVSVFLLAGCTGNFDPGAFYRASALCESNGGLKEATVGVFGNLKEVRCNNDAVFNYDALYKQAQARKASSPPN